MRRILEMKYRLGLFTDPYRYSDEEREQGEIYKPAHLEAARDMARKSIVLLKNEEALLPLAADGISLAVIGPLADSEADMIGPWSAAGESRGRPVSLLEGIPIYNPSGKLPVIYPDRRRAALAPAYDFVSTVPYIPEETAALKVSRSKRFDEFSEDELAHMAARAHLPEKIVLDTARKTAALFHEQWQAEKKNLPLAKAVIDAVKAHTKTVPLGL